VKATHNAEPLYTAVRIMFVVPIRIAILFLIRLDVFAQQILTVALYIAKRCMDKMNGFKYVTQSVDRIQPYLQIHSSTTAMIAIVKIISSVPAESVKAMFARLTGLIHSYMSWEPLQFSLSCVVASFAAGRLGQILEVAEERLHYLLPLLHTPKAQTTLRMKLMRDHKDNTGRIWQDNRRIGMIINNSRGK
jgi:hypothetical protein